MTRQDSTAPVRRGRLDPFLAAGFGYHRLTNRYAEGGEGSIERRIVFNAPAVRLSVGLPIFVSRGISIGPRFDQVLIRRGRERPWAVTFEIRVKL